MGVITKRHSHLWKGTGWKIMQMQQHSFGRYSGGSSFGMQCNPNQFNWFNNWNWSFCHEYNMDHKGHSCDWDMPRANHNPSMTRVNIHLFPGISLCGAQKTITPSCITNTGLLGAERHKYVKLDNMWTIKSISIHTQKIVSVPKSQTYCYTWWWGWGWQGWRGWKNSGTICLDTRSMQQSTKYGNIDFSKTKYLWLRSQ